MADLEFTVAMIGQAQAEKGLDNLAKKSDQVAKAEKMREKATEAANKAQTKAGIPTFGQPGASSKLDPFKAAQYRQKQAEAAIRAQQLDQKTQERAQQQAAKAEAAANAKPNGSNFGRLASRVGGFLARAGGVGELGSVANGLGGLAAYAMTAVVAFKLLGKVISENRKIVMEKAEAEIKSMSIVDAAQKMKGQSGIRALESQGANLLRLESLGPAFAQLAKDAAVSAKGGTSFGITDTQGAVLDAQRGGRGLDATRQIVEAARRLATLSGTGLQEAVKQLQDVGFRGGDGNAAISRALSVREERRITAEEVARREANLAASATVGTIQQGRGLQARTGLADQANLGMSIESLTRSLIETQNPAMIMNSELLKENSVRLASLEKALDSLGVVEKTIDWLMYFSGDGSLRGQRDEANRAVGNVGYVGNLPGDR